ncbi:hypothetical protein [Dendronalium phyllosphericum]|nr:hypothetical protein [Dendronalium phyllosphericum]
MASKTMATTISTIASLIVIGISSNQTAIATTLYHITDIGTLSGTSSTAVDINDLGQVVGTSDTTSGDLGYVPGAFLWENGIIRNLGFSRANSINNSGQVVGLLERENSGLGRAVLWQNGALKDIGALYPNGESFATDINDTGQIIGSSESDGSCLLKVDSSGNVISNSIPFPIRNTLFQSINNSSQIAGAISREEFNAFLAENGVLTELEPLPNDTSSLAQNINNFGQIVGYSYSTSGPTFDPKAVVWKNGKITQLETSNSYLSIAQDISDSGQIVGYNFAANNIYGNTSALLWVNSKVLNLNSLVAPNSDKFDVLTKANGINNVGQIVGTGLINGQERAFLATPIFVDEPASILGLLTVGTLGVSSAFRCKLKQR